MLSGRDPAKLVRLGDQRGVPARAASLQDEPGLRGLLDEASAVINCAGPFTLSGDALLRAAIDTGTHYVDSTGEQAFIRLVFDRHGAAAEKAGVALVPALGFDYAPGDCIARLTASGHEPLEELVLAYAVRGFGMSRGTIRSALEALKGGDVVYDDGELRPAPSGVFRASFDFPEPIGHQLMSRYPSGEVITAPAPYADEARRLADYVSHGRSQRCGGPPAPVSAAGPSAEHAHAVARTPEPRGRPAAGGPA
jgi:short subunit dehydrogenase-like uncharacterized protein